MIISTTLTEPYAPNPLRMKRTQILSLSHFKSVITQTSWAPVVYRDDRRHRSSFGTSVVCALDIDHGYALDDSIRILNRMEAKYIIATTKSHRKVKHTKTKVVPATDRYRIIMFFEKPIDDLELYEYNLRRYIQMFGADSCGDGARFFFPCKRVVNYTDGGRLPVLKISKVIKQQQTKRQLHYKKIHKLRGTLPRWIDRFLTNGELCHNGSRHTTIYSVARNLRGYGKSLSEVERLIAAAPFARDGRRTITDTEIIRTIRDGYERGD